MAAKIFRINYKSDFILTLNSDAGWMTPFCIKFWTGAPSQAFFVGWDGTTYTHCSYDPSEPTKLVVQFDDHHLPIGDLKFQIAYHFTVADFPNDTEDEVINPDNITTEIDGQEYHVMLDLNGETAPEIEFSLPAYANEAQRIANEEQRIANEQQRIHDEETRIANEETRQRNEATRIAQEEARVSEFARLKRESQQATTDANDAATLANQKAQLAQDKAALAQEAATLANQKAQLAADKAALANDAAQLANEKAALAQQKAEYAQTQGGYAKDQGDYAKDQGDYAKAQGTIVEEDHSRAEADHGIAVDDHTQAGNDHTRAEADHGVAVDDHTQAGNDHTRAESDHGIAVDDHTQAGNDHTRAESDHGIAADDHTQAGNDHTRAESDHTRAESDHAAVEVYVDSLGAFDISAYHATGGVLAKYADLTAALGTNGANIPDALRKGGMSVKFVLISDNKYVQYFLTKDEWSASEADWEKTNIQEELSQLRSEVDGVITNKYAINGYNQIVGNYDFKKDVSYTFRIDSTSNNIYIAIIDANGNVLRSNQEYTTFPTTFTWIPDNDYSGAHLKIGHNGAASYNVIVTHKGLSEDVKEMSEFLDATKIISSETLSGEGFNNTIEVYAGNIYKLVVESGVNGGYIYLIGEEISQFVISGIKTGTYYIPVFEDGSAHKYIRLYHNNASGTVSITYSLYRYGGVSPEYPNISFPVYYQKSVDNTLLFDWIQGYWTSQTQRNESTQWCNTRIQYNRGRRITITFQTGYYVILRRITYGSFIAENGIEVTSGTTFNTSNWGPWMIGVRRSDYSALTPEQAAAAITITQVDGDVYSVPVGMDDVYRMVNDPVMKSRIASLEAKSLINPRLGTLELGRFVHHLNVEAASPLIPSQSLYDIAYAKFLGFKMIEANIQVCSDGVAVVKHGNGGKLGAGLLFADGSTLTADTLFSAVSSTTLREEVSYNSRITKYNGHIPTLAEFCKECNSQGIIPFLRGVTTAQLNEVRKYLPDEKIVVEGPASRGDFKGLMTNYGGDASSTAEGILTACNAKGQPFYYCWAGINTATDEKLTEVAQTLHANGYLLGGAYLYASKYFSLSEKGLDIYVSTNDYIPPFNDGNAINVLKGNDQNLIMTNASYNSTDDVIEVQNGGMIYIENSEIGATIGKICVRIRYNGNLTIRLGNNNDDSRDLSGFASDGSKEIVLTSQLQKRSKPLRITANEATTIYDIKVAVSIF